MDDSISFGESCSLAATRLYRKQSGLDDDAIDDYLEHHGIKGMKWGQRRWQNDDGSLTAAGREHYGVGQERQNRAKSEADFDGDSGRYPRGTGEVKNTRQTKKFVKNIRKLAKHEFDSDGSDAKAYYQHKVMDSPQVKDILARTKNERDAVVSATDKTLKMAEDFVKSDVAKKYVEEYWQKESDRYKKTLTDRGIDDETAAEEAKSYVNEMKDFDSDQSVALSEWARRKGPGFEEMMKSAREGEALEKQYKESLNKYISEFTGAAGDLPLSGVRYGSNSANEVLNRRLIVESYYSKFKGRLGYNL